MEDGKVRFPGTFSISPIQFLYWSQTFRVPYPYYDHQFIIIKVYVY